jgi:hypothetical protein
VLIFSHFRLIDIKRAKKWSQNFTRVFTRPFININDSDDCNVIIVVGNNQNIKEFRAHSYILRARSPYFKNALEFQTTFIASADGWIANNNLIEFIKNQILILLFLR